MYWLRCGHRVRVKYDVLLQDEPKMVKQKGTGTRPLLNCTKCKCMVSVLFKLEHIKGNQYAIILTCKKGHYLFIERVELE